MIILLKWNDCLDITNPTRRKLGMFFYVPKYLYKSGRTLYQLIQNLELKVFKVLGMGHSLDHRCM
jgi:hypothetical protein